MKTLGVFWTVVTNIIHVIVGMVLFLFGSTMVWYQMQHPPAEKLYVYIGLGIAAFGTLIIPTVLPIAKQILVVIFPNGVSLPMFGGRRSTDPPVPPVPPTPPVQ